jgi:ABC-type transporter Mla subunit MlaD
VKRSLMLFPTLLFLAAACKSSDSRIVYVDFSAVGEIKEGAPVRLGGIDIGIVEKLTLGHSGVRATLLIQRSDAPIQINDRVAVRPVGIFGAQEVEIIPASTDGPPLRNRDTLHAAPSDSMATTREALSRAVIREFTKQLFSSADSNKRKRP